MTPYEMARRECADFVNGGCIWTIDGGCLLARKPLKPCQYFERCILNLPDQPGAEKMPNYFGYVQARQEYLKLQKKAVPEEEFRTCPDCGRPLAKRQRVCALCVKKRRRLANRQAQVKRREAVSS